MTRTLAVVLAAGLSLLPVGATARDGAGAAVDVLDSTFDPGDLVVEEGTEVTWTHRGQLPHSVTASDGSFDSHPACSPACMGPGETFSHTFAQTGTVTYYCKIHGNASGGGMAGTVTVVPEGELGSTAVTSLDATATDTSVEVAGTALFEGEDPNLVAEDGTGDGPLHPGMAASAGVDLVGAYISQPDPDVPELLFEWEVTELPDTGSLPEIVRYGFPFKAGAAGFMAQAKFSNLVSGTTQDDPIGHVEHVGGNAFQLRGGCAPDDAGVIACRHVEWLDGAFDTDTGRVQVLVPIGGPNTPTVQPGVEIVPNPDSLGGNPTASFQAYVSNNSTEDEAFWDPSQSYSVPERTVRLGLVPAGAPAAYTAQGTVGEDGTTFSGSVSTDGLAAGSYDLVAEACFGTNCGSARTAVTLP